MFAPAITFRQITTACAVLLLTTCSAAAPQTVASNPPRVAPGTDAAWYTVAFETNSFVINPYGQKVIEEVGIFLQQNPHAVATIIGRTDTVGNSDDNMRLSHHRAEAVRESLVRVDDVAADRIETRWTGETRLDMDRVDGVAAAGNRVVDIAIH